MRRWCSGRLDSALITLQVAGLALAVEIIVARLAVKTAVADSTAVHVRLVLVLDAIVAASYSGLHAWLQARPLSRVLGRPSRGLQRGRLGRDIRKAAVVCRHVLRTALF